jgi:hypothetical protein
MMLPRLLFISSRTTSGGCSSQDIESMAIVVESMVSLDHSPYCGNEDKYVQ